MGFDPERVTFTECNDRGLTVAYDEPFLDTMIRNRSLHGQPHLAMILDYEINWNIQGPWLY
jgi:hypothetical protein